MKSCTRLCKKQKIDNFKLCIKIHPFRFLRQNGDFVDMWNHDIKLL